MKKISKKVHNSKMPEEKKLLARQKVDDVMSNKHKHE